MRPHLPRSPALGAGIDRARAVGGHGADVVVGDPGGADPHRVGVGFEPDERDPGAGGGIGGDEVGGAPRSRAPSPSTMSTCSGSSRRMAIRSGNRFRIDMTSLRGSCNAATTQ